MEKTIYLADIESGEVVKIKEDKIKDFDLNLWKRTFKRVFLQYKASQTGLVAPPKFTHMVKDSKGKEVERTKNIIEVKQSIRKYKRSTQQKANSTKAAKGQIIHFIKKGKQTSKYIRHGCKNYI